MALDALERLAFAMVAVTSSVLGDVGGREVTFLAWRALVVLGAGEGVLRITDLGTRLGMSRPSTSKLVRRLERRRRAILAGALEGDTPASLEEGLTAVAERLKPWT